MDLASPMNEEDLVASSLEAETRWMDGADEAQAKLMQEVCMLVDRDDQVVGHDTKKHCHLNANILGQGLLHRAFSVFIFNANHELLMQKRSAVKITFPSYWANSCCSHPLYTQEEMEMQDALGVKRAAQRKIFQELGIPPVELPLTCFHFLTRVHYQAQSNAIWGEHEIDYVLFCTPPHDVIPKPNPNEVAAVQYLSLNALDKFVANADANGTQISPWFRIIYASFLPQWWEALVARRLEAVKDVVTIHRASMVS